MTRKQALAELISKVEAGTLIPDNLIVSSEVSAMIDLAVNVSDLHGDVWADLCNAYDGSLDAAKALHEAVLPDWYVFIKGQKGYVWFAELMDRDDNRHPQTEGETPARAWLLSILRALHSMEPDA